MRLTYAITNKICLSSETPLSLQIESHIFLNIPYQFWIWRFDIIILDCLKIHPWRMLNYLSAVVQGIWKPNNSVLGII